MRELEMTAVCQAQKASRTDGVKLEPLGETSFRRRPIEYLICLSVLIGDLGNYQGVGIEPMMSI